MTYDPPPKGDGMTADEWRRARARWLARHEKRLAESQRNRYSPVTTYDGFRTGSTFWWRYFAR